MLKEILLECFDNGVALVTLNRPDAMNALSSVLRAEFHQVMVQIKHDNAINCVVLTGAGERAFTAGLDLKELGDDDTALDAATNPNPASHPVNAIHECGKPVIGAINGVAITGGFELALGCDILIASENARFADTHQLVGLMPGWGLSQKLSRIIGLARAKEMSFTGRFIDANTALDWGIVNKVTSADALLPEAIAMAESIATIEPKFISDYTKLIENGYSMPFEKAIAHETNYSRQYNVGITATDIEARRLAVIERGRKQK